MSRNSLEENNDNAKEYQIDGCINNSPGNYSATSLKAPLTIMKTVLKKLDEFLFLCLAGVRCRKEEQLELDTKCKKKLSMRTTAENEKAHSPGHSLCSECGK